MIITGLQIAEGCKAPFGYGFSHYSSYGDYIVAYPVPLHWIVRYARQFWFWSIRPAKPDALAEAYLRGRREAEKKARDTEATVLRMVRELRQP